MRVVEKSFFQKGLKIIINWPLYEKLLHGTLGRDGKRELTVETIDDLPPDGTIGVYNPRSNKITADIGEIGVLSLLKRQTRQEVDDEVTNVLAHEGEHYIQQERIGYIKDIDRFILLAAAFVLTLFFAYGAWWMWNHTVQAIVFKLFGMSVGSTIAAVLLSIVTWLCFARIFIRIVYIVFALLKHAAYRLCWCERDARKFAKAALKNPAWADVVIVEAPRDPDGILGAIRDRAQS